MNNISQLFLIGSLSLLSTGCYKTPSSKVSAITPTAQAPVHVVSSNRAVVLHKIQEIVAKQLGIEVQSMKNSSPLSKQKVAADDLDVVEIIMTIEEDFRVEIKDEEVSVSAGTMQDGLSVDKLTDIVMRKQTFAQ